MSDMQINAVKGNISLNNKNVKGKLTMPEKTKAFINYEDDHELYNRPRINGEELIHDKSFEDLGDNIMTNTEIMEIFNMVFKRGD